MKEKTIKKNELANFVAGLLSDYQVFAPAKEEESLVLKEMQAEGDIDLDIGVGPVNTKKSIKEFFFPQKERFFSYDLTKPGEMEEPVLSDKKRVIFGVRPCDVNSISVFDAIFTSDQYPDPYYIKRRERTTIVAIGCNKPETTCFCVDTGGGPFSADGSDLLLVDLGDEYLVQVLTEKGETLVNGSSGFSEPKSGVLQKRDGIVEEAQKAIKSDIKIKKVKGWLDNNFDAPFWDTVHEKCIGCGTCTYLCPTCHCFDILDETKGEKGERIRIWDSCMYPQFTLHASGGNPRKSGKERMRQRVMHKFKYFVDNNEMVACTGCGRCVKYCPVNLDIREVLKQIQVS